jgi:ribose transport system ATP-binding protein
MAAQGASPAGLVAGGGQPPRISVRAINKSFPGVRALNNVDLTVLPGEMHGIVGQNGAGKSTLIRILAGAEQPDDGEVLLDGEPVRFKSPQDAQKAGIFTVYQELSLFPTLSVAENIHVDGLSRGKWGGVSWRQVRERAEADLGRLGFDIDVRTPVGELRMAHQQAVELAKALRQNARVILLDEPTATLSKPEADRLFALLRRLQAQGIALIYISHRMDELYEMCSRISVFRDGRRVGTYEVGETSHSEVVRAMLGRLIDESVAEPIEGVTRMRGLGVGKRPESVALKVEGLSDGAILDDVGFSLGRGEVLGVTGLAGNGQAELAGCLFGARKATAGRFVVHGQERAIASPADAVRLGIGLVPEDRKDEGLALDMSITSNITMASLPQFTRYSFLRRAAEVRKAAEMRKSLGIKASGLSQAVGKLSGGNQQKVVFAKWLLNGANILVLDEPTRGVDVGAKAELYELIRVFVRDGGSVVLITSELEEALMCDRVLVMRRGRVAGVLESDELEHDGETAVLDLSA